MIQLDATVSFTYNTIESNCKMAIRAITCFYQCAENSENAQYSSCCKGFIIQFYNYIINYHSQCLDVLIQMKKLLLLLNTQLIINIVLSCRNMYGERNPDLWWIPGSKGRSIRNLRGWKGGCWKGVGGSFKTCSIKCFYIMFSLQKNTQKQCPNDSIFFISMQGVSSFRSMFRCF